MYRLNLDLMTFAHADSCQISNDQVFEMSVKSVFLFFLILYQECKLVSRRTCLKCLFTLFPAGQESVSPGQ